MGTIVVVHGAGTRTDGIDRLEAAVRAGVAAHPTLASLEVRMCRWGEQVGAVPVGQELALPAEAAARALRSEPDAEMTDAARWSLLAADPLFELRLAAAIGGQASGTSGGPMPAIGVIAPGEDLKARLLAMASAPDLLPASSGIAAPELRAAVERVAGSLVLMEAAAAVGDTGQDDLVGLAARAVVAELIADHRADAPGTTPELLADGSMRDRFVETLETQLTEGGRGIVPGWLKQKVTALVAPAAMSFARDRRDDVQGANSLTFADILHYLRRGARMRAVVVDCLATATPPVIALGHSLGGIMLVDILSGPTPPHADLLVTVGSQAPLLYTYDALERPRVTAAPGDEPFGPTRRPFTPWLNLYNRNDFVSFLARPVFTAVPGLESLDIRDTEIHGPEAFPASHSAYWTQPLTFQAIADRVAGVAAFGGGRHG